MASQDLPQPQAAGGKAESVPQRSSSGGGLSGLPPSLCAAPEFIASGGRIAPGRELVEDELGVGNPPGGHVGGSVSSWLTTLLSSQHRDIQPAPNERSKVIGIPAANMESATLRAPDSQMQPGQGYLGPAMTNMPPAGLGASSTSLLHHGEISQTRALVNPRPEDVDYTPIQYSMSSDQMGGQQQVLGQSNAIHNGVSSMNDQVYFAGAVMDRPNPEHLMHNGRLPLDIDPAGGHVVTDEHTGQVHVVVHDLHQLKTSSFLPLKLDNKGQFVGHQRSPADMRSLPVVGVGGDIVGPDPNVALTSMVNNFQSIQSQTPKTRWKPNQAQLTLLERHFNAGTDELILATVYSSLTIEISENLSFSLLRIHESNPRALQCCKVCW